MKLISKRKRFIDFLQFAMGSNHTSGLFWWIGIHDVFWRNICIGIMMLLFITICLHYQAFYEMFVHTIEKWNPLAANQNDESFLCDLIHFHATVKEWDSLLLFMKFEIFSETSFLFRWFLHTVDVYSPFLLVQILSSTVLISTALFFLDPVRKIILKSDA